MAYAEDAPPRMLRRAENLRTTQDGKFIQELEGPTATLQHHRRNSLGASLLKRFHNVKTGLLSRSRSVNGHSSPVQNQPPLQETDDDDGNHNRRRRGHSRSLSELNTVPPDPTLCLSPSRIDDNDPTMHRRALSTVSEKSIVTPQSSPSAAATVGGPPQQTSKGTGSGDVVVPQLLQLGTPMTKVSAKKHKKFVFRLDPDLGQIVWESKQHKIIPIENIKEIRSGKDARYYREQFQLAQEYEDRWLTIIYILDGTYKTLHLIVATRDVFRMWDSTLRELHAIRQELMSGLGNLEVRQALWEKQYWKNADEERDQKLTFEEVEKLCRRLNINSSQDDLRRLFDQADVRKRNFLEFDDFRKFVKLLKGRPEIHRLYNKLKARTFDVFDSTTFEIFMREKQESELPTPKLQELFLKYTDSKSVMPLDVFTTFLLSPDNSAFSDQQLKVHHDMTRPLPEYYVSSSHNTYLVGHQLVGDSTIEGYIRALLHSCRSVEVDIYDGDTEPMIFHGKSFTSKVSLRQVCEAIMKYGFVASPYPIIISAEVHCGLLQQDMIADIMIAVFGESLVRETLEGRSKIEVLPSPEDLKGKILLKTKNLFLTSSDSGDGDSSSTDPSTSSASASESDFTDTVHDVGVAIDKKRNGERERPTGPLSKVSSNVLQRVRSIGKPPPSPIRVHSTPVTSAIASPLPIASPPSSARRFSEPTDTVSPSPKAKPKSKMSLALVSLLVYTVGVKWRGLNKKEEYAPEHMFSLSENMANKILKMGMVDLIKHTRSHLVRIYPKGTRVSSTNFEPHRFWASGSQLVAINWQTFDLGYMINHAMFQRNGRSGYVLKPLALRVPNKDLLMKKTKHLFRVSIISAQQLPRPKNALGHEIAAKNHLDPYVEVSLYIPDWPVVGGALSRANSTSKRKSKRESLISPTLLVSAPSSSSGGSVVSGETDDGSLRPPLSELPGPSSIPGRTVWARTGTVKNNGFNPVWEERLNLPFECVGDMMDLVFVRFVVRGREDKEGDEPLAVYCASLGSLGRGYRHLPLHDSQLSQFLFSTLFVRLNVLNTD